MVVMMVVHMELIRTVASSLVLLLVHQRDGEEGVLQYTELVSMFCLAELQYCRSRRVARRPSRAHCTRLDWPARAPRPHCRSDHTYYAVRQIQYIMHTSHDPAQDMDTQLYCCSKINMPSERKARIRPSRSRLEHLER